MMSHAANMNTLLRLIEHIPQEEYERMTAV